METTLSPDLSKQWTDELVRSVSYFRSYWIKHQVHFVNCFQEPKEVQRLSSTRLSERRTKSLANKHAVSWVHQVSKDRRCQKFILRLQYRTSQTWVMSQYFRPSVILYMHLHQEVFTKLLTTEVSISNCLHCDVFSITLKVSVQTSTYSCVYSCAVR